MSAKSREQKGSLLPGLALPQEHDDAHKRLPEKVKKPPRHLVVLCERVGVRCDGTDEELFKALMGHLDRMAAEHAAATGLLQELARDTSVPRPLRERAFLVGTRADLLFESLCVLGESLARERRKRLPVGEMTLTPESDFVPVVVEVFNQVLGAFLPGVELPVGEMVAKAIRKRYEEDRTRRTREWWKEYFERVARTPFLIGKGGGKDAFKASLLWLTKPQNMEKVLSGYYREDGRGVGVKSDPLAESLNACRRALGVNKAVFRQKCSEMGVDPELMLARIKEL